MKKLLFAATALTLAFASCKKNDSGGPGPGPGPGPNPGPNPQTKLLKKVTKTQGNTVTVYTLSYDSRNRLTGYRNAANSEYIKFEYDDNGNVVRSEELNEGFKNIFTYRYKSSGIPESGTFKSWELTAGEPDDLIEDDIMNYEVSNNKVTKIVLDMLQSQQEVSFEVSYDGDNVKKIESKNPALPFVANFSFGSKKSATVPVYRFVMDHAGYSAQFMSRNELLSFSFVFGGTPAGGVTSQYTYDSAGYPLTSNDGTASYKYEY